MPPHNLNITWESADTVHESLMWK